MCIVGFLQLRLLRYKKKEKIATILRKIDYRTIKIWILPVEFDLDSRFLSLLHRKVTCNSLKSKKSNPCKPATAPKAKKVTLASLQQLQKHKKWPLQACNSSKSFKSFKSRNIFDLCCWKYPARPVGAEALSPGHRPGYNGQSTRRPVRAKALQIAGFFKAFALTGRQVCAHNNPGRCPGLRASALSGRAASGTFGPSARTWTTWESSV